MGILKNLIILQVRIWDITAGTPLISTLEGHASIVNYLALSPEEDLIASGADDGKVQLYGISDEYTLSEVDYREISNVQRGERSPDD